jgi:arabinose-5-phosphate isomerase
MSDPIVATPPDAARLVAQGREVLRIEADAVAALVDRVDGSFVTACRIILACRGRVVVSGIGKSGARRAQDRGHPRLHRHAGVLRAPGRGEPRRPRHGDPRRRVRGAVQLGRTDEVMAIVPMVKRQGAKLIAITATPSRRWRAGPTRTWTPAWRRRPAR